MISLDVIIVNWNAGGQLKDCLISLVETERKGFSIERVVVVDNASTDHSLANLEDLSLPLTIIRNQTNRGFGAACNQGARGGTADYLLFLNPDTRLFESSLSVPIAFLEHPYNQKEGIVGIQLVDETGNISRTCARFPTPGSYFWKMLGLDRLSPLRFPSCFMSDWDHSASRPVDHVMGAFFLVRRELFEMLGGFDERFFVYFEDLDFSLRARLKGWKSHYLVDACAYHKGGGTSQSVKAKRLFYSLRSRIQYGFKHFGRFDATLLLLGTLLIEPLSRLAFCLLRGSVKGMGETLVGFSYLYRDLPAILGRLNKH